MEGLLIVVVAVIFAFCVVSAVSAKRFARKLERFVSNLVVEFNRQSSQIMKTGEEVSMLRGELKEIRGEIASLRNESISLRDAAETAFKAVKKLEEQTRKERERQEERFFTGVNNILSYNLDTARKAAGDAENER